MKKILSFLLVLSIFTCLIALPVGAEQRSFAYCTSSIEYYDDGSYCVTDIFHFPSTGDRLQAVVTPTSGAKASTYYNASGTAMWSVCVTGYFNYTYGVSVYATSATADVYIYDSNCSLISKSANVQGATASASCTVKYVTLYTDKTVTLTCDEYGNLS